MNDLQSWNAGVPYKGVLPLLRNVISILPKCLGCVVTRLTRNIKADQSATMSSKLKCMVNWSFSVLSMIWLCQYRLHKIKKTLKIFLTIPWRLSYSGRIWYFDLKSCVVSHIWNSVIANHILKNLLLEKFQSGFNVIHNLVKLSKCNRIIIWEIYWRIINPSGVKSEMLIRSHVPIVR